MRDAYNALIARFVNHSHLVKEGENTPACVARLPRSTRATHAALTPIALPSLRRRVMPFAEPPSLVGAVGFLHAHSEQQRHACTRATSACAFALPSALVFFLRRGTVASVVRCSVTRARLPRPCWVVACGRPCDAASPGSTVDLQRSGWRHARPHQRPHPRRGGGAALQEDDHHEGVCLMQIVRVYTGADGESHFEDVTPEQF